MQGKRKFFVDFDQSFVHQTREENQQDTTFLSSVHDTPIPQLNI